MIVWLELYNIIHLNCFTSSGFAQLSKISYSKEKGDHLNVARTGIIPPPGYLGVSLQPLDVVTPQNLKIRYLSRSAHHVSKLHRTRNFPRYLKTVLYGFIQFYTTSGSNPYPFFSIFDKKGSLSYTAI